MIPKLLEKDHRPKFGENVKLHLFDSIEENSNEAVPSIYSSDLPQEEEKVVEIDQHLAKTLLKFVPLFEEGIQHLNVQATVSATISESQVLVKSTSSSSESWFQDFQAYLAQYTSIQIEYPETASQDVLRHLSSLESSSVIISASLVTSTQLAVSGKKEIVEKFQQDIERTYQQVSEKIELSREDYEFFSQIKLHEFVHQHPNVSIKLSDHESQTTFNIELLGTYFAIEQAKASILDECQHCSIAVPLDNSHVSYLISPEGTCQLKQFLKDNGHKVAIYFKSVQSTTTLNLLTDKSSYEANKSCIVPLLQAEIVVQDIDVPKLLPSDLNTVTGYHDLEESLVKQCQVDLIKKDKVISVVGFRTKVTHFASKLGSFFQTSEHDLEPVTINIQPILARALLKHKEGLCDRISDFSPNFNVEIIMPDKVQVTPKLYFPSDWNDKVQGLVEAYIQEKCLISVVPNVVQQAIPEIVRILQEASNCNAPFESKYDPSTDSKLKLLLAGSVEQVKQTEAAIKEILVRHSRVTETLVINEEDYLFIKCFHEAAISKQYSDVNLDFDDASHTLTCTGAAVSVNNVKQALDKVSKHSVVPVETGQTVLRFLCQNKTSNLISYLKEQKCPHVAIQCHYDNQSSEFILKLLCIANDQQRVHTIVSGLKSVAVTKSIALPQAYSTLPTTVHSQCRELCNDLMRKSEVIIYEYPSLTHIEVTGFSVSVDTAISSIEGFVINECSVTHSLSIESGNWKLLQQNKQKWSKIQEEAEQNNIELLSDTGNDATVAITLRGDKIGVKRLSDKIQSIKTEIITKSLTLRRPGAAKQFRHKNWKWRQIGIEQEHHVVIETEELKESQCLKKLDSQNDGTQCEKVIFAVVSSSHGPKSINILVGDITDMSVDVIVNAANKHLKHIGGVAEVIVKKGGQEIQDDCSAHTIMNGDLMDGETYFSKITGRLPCKALIHAVGPRWEGGNKNEERYLQEACATSLEEAERSHYRSIALPAISAGIYQFPMEVCAENLIHTAYYFLQKQSRFLTEINFVVTNLQNVQYFKKALVEELGHDKVHDIKLSTNTPVQTSPSFQSFTSRSSPRKKAFQQASPIGQKNATLQIKLIKGSLLDVKVSFYKNCQCLI